MEVFLASGNLHKLDELNEIVHREGLLIDLKGADQAGGMPDVDESGQTFEENARLKADALLQNLSGEAWALADDSGLLVDALDGEPGVYSARYAGPAGNATANNIKLLLELKGIPVEKRTARFACVLCFANKNGQRHFFSGTCEGHIMLAPSGDRGFGYDPLFCPLGYRRTFADLGDEIKNKLSHRARAVAKWAEFVRTL